MPLQTTSENRPGKRRAPAQKRALQTQELIFEAATRLLEQEGLKGFNTNRLAELSGFSVGTVYQYFANKEAILVALGQREIDKVLAGLQRNLREHAAALMDDDPQVRIRAAVKMMLGAFGGRQRARKILVEAAIARGRTDVLDRPVLAMAALLSSEGITRSGAAPVKLSAESAFVLTQAVIGALRAALLREPAMLKRPAFEDALVRLISGYLLHGRAD
jgi:AcrR family transcriptional regulator